MSIMSEREQGELGQPLFLDETPDLRRSKQTETTDIDALFADEDALPPHGSNGATTKRKGLRLPKSWSSMSARFDSPSTEFQRTALIVALVVAAALLGFFSVRALLN
jgi:hypothetical protein